MSDDTSEERLSRLRAEAAGHLERKDVAAALELLAGAIRGELTHPLVPDYLELAGRSANPRAIEQLVRAGHASWPQLDPTRARGIVHTLAAHGLLQLAWELTAQGSLAADPEVACLRGGCALQLGRPDDAVAASDVAIAGLLHDGLTVADFIRLSLRNAPSEALLRYERSAVAHIPRLHEPLALRWEALRRGGRKSEAREMREVCIRHFPERASVWATAGNHALDEGELERADDYFERCLQLDSNWPAGLAGKAIVFETRKDWNAALQLRERVVTVTDAMSGKDAASLHRLIRYAAALGRVERWAEADPLFRRCLGLGAFAKLPGERPVLLRVFSRELYAPAIIATLTGSLSGELGADEGLALAVREAELIGKLYGQLRAAGARPTPEQLVLLGMCAWLAGDAVHAYALLDEAELEDAPDLALHYLLADSAATAGAPDRESVEAFATRAAQAVLERVARGEVAPEDDRVYAQLIAARSGTAEVPVVQLPELAGAGAEPAGVRLRRLVAYRAAARTAGKSAFEAARASTSVLESLLSA